MPGPEGISKTHKNNDGNDNGGSNVISDHGNGINKTHLKLSVIYFSCHGRELAFSKISCKKSNQQKNVTLPK